MNAPPCTLYISIVLLQIRKGVWTLLNASVCTMYLMNSDLWCYCCIFWWKSKAFFAPRLSRQELFFDFWRKMLLKVCCRESSERWNQTEETLLNSFCHFPFKSRPPAKSQFEPQFLKNLLYFENCADISEYNSTFAL